MVFNFFLNPLYEIWQAKILSVLMHMLIPRFILSYIYAASVFGEQRRLEPMSPERKARWIREIDWLLSVTDHIVELVPSQQKSKDGSSMEVTAVSL